MSFVRRLLNFTFVLGLGKFGESGTDTVELSGLRASVSVLKAGGPGMGSTQVRIFGMALSLMNQLTTLGLIATTNRRNSITIVAGDEGSVPSTVFTGTIHDAWGDFNSAPEVPFLVQAHTGFINAIAPHVPTSFKGSADVATMLAGLAMQMGVEFENNGVSAKLSNPYLCGSARVQARAIVEAAGIEWNGIDNGVLAIWNPGSSRGGSVPVVSPETGMIGYPSYTSLGIRIRTIFNPSISFGQKIRVESSLRLPSPPQNFDTPANKGIFVVNNVAYQLETMMPNGKWEMEVSAAPIGFMPFVPS